MSQTDKPPSFLRHAAVYSLGNFALYAANFVLLPLYVRCLHPSEYGGLEVLSRLGELLAMCLLFLALRQGIIPLYRQAADDGERQRVAATALTMLLGLLLAGMALAVLATGSWCSLYWSGEAAVLRLGLIASFLEFTSVVVLAFSQARLESAFVVVMNFLGLACRLGLCILLVAALGWGLAGVVWAWTIAAALMASTVFTREAVRAGLRPDCRIAGELCRFMLPLLPAALCSFVLNNGDRFLLLHYCGEAEVGVYALGYKMAGIVSIIVVMPLMAVWGARMYDVARQPDAAIVFGQVATRILFCMAFFGLGVSLLADEAVAVLGGPSYAPAAEVIPLVMLAYWLLALNNLQENGFYVRRQMVKKVGVMMAATVVVLAGYFWLIPAHAGLGAAWATVIGFGFQAFLTRRVVRRIFRVHYEDRRLAILVLSAVTLWLGVQGLPQAAWAVVPKVSLWLAWPALLWLLGWFRPEEKAWTIDLLRRQLRLPAAAGRSPIHT